MRSICFFRPTYLILLATFLLPACLWGGETAISLPPPQSSGGMPLMQALAKRQTTRSFADQPLSRQQLSNLLWAAFGVNRPRAVKAGLGRTAPSARNKQEIELNVVLAEGVFVYEPELNRLRPVISGDFRAKIAPSAAAKAAVTLIYTADSNLDFAQVDTGFIGQNVYLYAASEGLNAWFYALRNPEIEKTLRLAPDRKPLYGQSVGYPVR